MGSCSHSRSLFCTVLVLGINGGLVWKETCKKKKFNVTVLVLGINGGLQEGDLQEKKIQRNGCENVYPICYPLPHISA
jgi:hypothetical protein